MKIGFIFLVRNQPIPLSWKLGTSFSVWLIGPHPLGQKLASILWVRNGHSILCIGNKTPFFGLEIDSYHLGWKFVPPFWLKIGPIPSVRNSSESRNFIFHPTVYFCVCVCVCQNLKGSIILKTILICTFPNLIFKCEILFLESSP